MTGFSIRSFAVFIQQHYQILVSKTKYNCVNSKSACPWQRYSSQVVSFFFIRKARLVWRLAILLNNLKIVFFGDSVHKS